MKKVQRCTALLRSGDQCAKYCKPNEVFCAVHQPGYVPKGAAVARPRPVSYEDRLRQFADSSDPRVAMAAIAALDKRRSSDSVGRSEPRADAFVAACTDEQLARLTAILNELRSFKAEVLRENPDLRPAERKIDAPVIKRDQPPRPAAEVSVAPAELAAAEVRGDEVTPLPRDQYAEVGLFITPTGDVSHNLGDDYARAILDGDITFEDARAAHEARQQQLKGLSR